MFRLKTKNTWTRCILTQPSNIVIVSLHTVFLERQWRTRHRRSHGSAVVTGHMNCCMILKSLLWRFYLDMTSRQTKRKTNNKQHKTEEASVSVFDFCHDTLNDYLHICLSRILSDRSWSLGPSEQWVWLSHCCSQYLSRRPEKQTEHWEYREQRFIACTYFLFLGFLRL